MPLLNSGTSYGAIARTLHWMTVALILAVFATGMAANNLPLTENAAIKRIFTLFSVHKTIGILTFLLGLLRLVATFLQAQPAPLHPERGIETFLAETTHRVLTLALILAPLTGWISHSATSDLAPILWPFAQSLPFVPETPQVAELFGALHQACVWFLAFAVALHATGALKHAFIDRDATLARMTRGVDSGKSGHGPGARPVIAAVLIWSAVLSAGLVPAMRVDRNVSDLEGEWAVLDAQIIVSENGKEVAHSTVFNIFLELGGAESPSTVGILNVTLPLDALTGPQADTIAALSLIPILTFSGTISGRPPKLEANGLLDLAGIQSEARFAIEINGSQAAISGAAPLPGAAHLILSVSATATRE